MAVRYLPIGSVIRLKDSSACTMIAGYLPTGPARPGYVWDYSGFKFPLGYVKDDEIYCFDQDQIEEVLALGYQDSEQFAFSRSLEEMTEKLKADAEMTNEGRKQSEEEV